jgi:predicted aminopeptidase
MQYRSRFEALYQGQEKISAQRIQKAALFDQMIDDHNALKKEWGGTSPYDNWFRPPLNNAKLASVLTYHNWVPAFNAMLAAENGDLVQFYKTCQELAEKAQTERDEILTRFINANE